MSINPDSGAMANDTDYSDFEYQQIAGHIELEDGGNVNGSAVHNIEPLEGGGGLDNNEVAELVYVQLTASVEVEAENGGTGGHVEQRGVLGANLGQSRDTELESAANRVRLGEAGDPGSAIVDTNSTSADYETYTQVEDRIFVPFTVHSGDGGLKTTTFTRSWRDLTGRGPVLDATDDINIHHRLVKSGGGPTQSVVRAHLVWDTAETSDAGRAFSVP